VAHPLTNEHNLDEGMNDLDDVEDAIMMDLVTANKKHGICLSML
jgi:hypothetical protein